LIKKYRPRAATLLSTAAFAHVDFLIRVDLAAREPAVRHVHSLLKAEGARFHHANRISLSLENAPIQIQGIDFRGPLTEEASYGDSGASR
jgi:hypothetical protein